MDSGILVKPPKYSQRQFEPDEIPSLRILYSLQRGEASVCHENYYEKSWAFSKKPWASEN